MKITKIKNDKKRYLELLLLGDEQESMVDLYLEKGDMFVADDNGVKAECVVVKCEDGVYELKNIAVTPEFQRMGYGKKLVEYILSYYNDCDTMYVGTGDSEKTLSFYKSCGFVESHIVKDFFIDNYDHPMFEDGKQLIDMIYLKKETKNMDKFKKILSGELYDPMDPEIAKEQFPKIDKVILEYNSISINDTEKREKMLGEILGSAGKNCFILSPFSATWGCNTYVGDNFFANFNFTLIDDAEVHIGNNVKFGPNVTIVTAGHPIYPELREKGIEYNLPVRIGNNVWMGAGVIVLPGVTIGDNCVIGAGSVVTKDIPANTVAVGSPCRVMREIGERDKKYYYKDMEIGSEWK